MAYQVLARKWRPKNFKEMVGQEHVLRALINALDENRLHHAYLFTGTRGVGKTTIARIISKSLNCETGVSSHPCGMCSICTEIDEGRFVDLIEVDAASRTKVEDTRELLENVQYATTRGRYKVYLIDEVHMLSIHSFNALLKTLEEPPPHVKFLLATTDPQKLPATVLSRCLQFSLKCIPLEKIVAHHQFILGEEGITFDDVALKHIARAADGSMRDSLSLLDQSIAFGHGKVCTDDVVAMLGFISKDHVQRILQSLAEQDTQALVDTVVQLAESSPDYMAVIDEILSVLHQMALVKQLPEAVDEFLLDKQSLLALAELFSPKDIQLYYQIALNGKRDLPLVPEPRNGLEMLLLRMLAFQPAGYSGGDICTTKTKPVAIQEVPVVEEKVAEQAISRNTTIDTFVSTTSELQRQTSTSSIRAEIEVAHAALGDSRVKKSRAAHSRQELSIDNIVTVGFLEGDDIKSTPLLPVKVQSHRLDSDQIISPVQAILEKAEQPACKAFVESQAVINEQFSDDSASDNMVSLGVSVQIVKASADLMLEGLLSSKSWDELLSCLSLSALAMELAQNCSLKCQQGNNLELVLSPRYAGLQTITNQERLQEALSVYFGTPQTISIEIGSTEQFCETPAQKTNRQSNECQQHAVDAIMNDPNIQQLQQLFGASVKQEAIKLIETKSEIA